MLCIQSSLMMVTRSSRNASGYQKKMRNHPNKMGRDNRVAFSALELKRARIQHNIRQASNPTRAMHTQHSNMQRY